MASETGVILDTIYTGKAVLGMLSEMRVNPHRFRGNRILFINTGVSIAIKYLTCLDMCAPPPPPQVEYSILLTEHWMM